MYMSCAKLKPVSMHCFDTGFYIRSTHSEIEINNYLNIVSIFDLNIIFN